MTDAIPLTITIPRRFNGPPKSGNGGYSCGALAAQLGVNDCTVRLHKPPPLDTPMTVRQTSNGRVELVHEDLVIGTAWASKMLLDIPLAPTAAQAQRAGERTVCHAEHRYPTCFVCGPARAEKDGLCLFPGPLNDWSLLACTWRPEPDLLDNSGRVRAEIVWAALDCPGFFAAVGETSVSALLGELHVQQRMPILGGQELIVYCWLLGREGRKFYGGVAIADQGGAVLACSRSVWIQLIDD